MVFLTEVAVDVSLSHGVQLVGVCRYWFECGIDHIVYCELSWTEGGCRKPGKEFTERVGAMLADGMKLVAGRFSINLKSLGFSPPAHSDQQTAYKHGTDRYCNLYRYEMT